MSILELINYPSDIRELTISDLILLSKEIREFLLKSISATGGHLSSNLGTIELTLAIHYLYDTPDDKIIWDIGHQSYTHKIITGRKNAMKTLRQEGGISGFTRISESVYDVFGAGHSSTSLSAASGIHVANQNKTDKKNTVAIIGDGALTAGMAFEALNNIGWLKQNILVVLNDNNMSISENVGAISNYFSEIQTQNSSSLFKSLGFYYSGAIDGHDLELLIETIKHLQTLNSPKILHAITKKGNGYHYAEENPIKYHGVSKFHINDGLKKQTANYLSYTQVFGLFLCDMAQKCEFIAVTPAMTEGSGMQEFAELYSDRFFDVGIAEQHAITFAAGAASQGLTAIVAIYSTFLQRGYDQLIHDVALQNLPVLFAIDRAGISAVDGPTHSGTLDMSYLRLIPNMTIMAPSDESECYNMLIFGLMLKKPVSVRYPRIGHGTDIKKFTIEHGKGVCIRTGVSVVIFSFGTVLKLAKNIAHSINATLCDMRFVKPLDEELVIHHCNKHDLVVTIEENSLIGGAGSACLELMADKNILKQVLRFGVPDMFIEHGSINNILESISMTEETIILKIKERLNERK